MENFKSYLDGINFNSRFEKLKKKLKNKSVLIYGAGIFFQYINKNYDLSSLKITGICDKKFNYDARGYYEGYKTLKPDEIINHINSFDYILICVLENNKIEKSLKKEFKNTKIKIMSFVKKPFLYDFLNNKNNTVVLIKQNGKKVYNPKIKNLKITFRGFNNYIEIKEPFIIKNKMTIRAINNTKITIDKNCVFYNLNIKIEQGAKLIIGKNFFCWNTRIYLTAAGEKSVEIGDDCLFSHGILIRPSDGHKIYDINSNKLINEPEDITIGNHVWVGTRAIILKGAHIPSNCIVGAGSIVNKKFNDENCIIAGSPAKIIKKDIRWER